MLLHLSAISKVPRSFSLMPRTVSKEKSASWSISAETNIASLIVSAPYSLIAARSEMIWDNVTPCVTGVYRIKVAEFISYLFYSICSQLALFSNLICATTSNQDIVKECITNVVVIIAYSFAVDIFCNNIVSHVND